MCITLFVIVVSCLRLSFHLARIKSGRHAVCNVPLATLEASRRSECVCMYKEHVVPSQFQAFNVIINLNDFIMLGILNADAFRALREIESRAERVDGWRLSQ